MPSLADMVKERLKKKSEKKESPPEQKKSETTYRPTSHKTEFETDKKDTKSEINKSVELNALKVLYANRFDTTTNMRKADMQDGLIKIWIEENEKLNERYKMLY